MKRENICEMEIYLNISLSYKMYIIIIDLQIYLKHIEQKCV